MTKAAEETVVECNGTQVSFGAAGSEVPEDALSILEPCEHALDVAATLTGSEVSDQGFRNGTVCIYLGTNHHCEGTTEITNTDWLCTNGDAQWTLSIDGFEKNAAYCTPSSWWWW